MGAEPNKLLRFLTGVIVGFFGGCLAGLCLLLVVFTVCTALGGGPIGGARPYNENDRPKNVPVGLVSWFAAFFIIIGAPTSGVMAGIIWAIRRNWRDTLANQTAADADGLPMGARTTEASSQQDGTNPCPPELGHSP